MIVLDATIALEILESRRHYQKVVAALAEYAGTNEIAAVSALTVSHLFYLAERHGVDLERVERLVASWQVFAVTDDDVSWAMAHYQSNDFEDALQVAAAHREGCSHFLTIDASLAKKYARTLSIQLIS